MFTCSSCHASSSCDYGSLESLMRSRGKCEICGDVADCLDCQGYKYAKPRSKPKPRSSSIAIVEKESWDELRSKILNAVEFHCSHEVPLGRDEACSLCMGIAEQVIFVLQQVREEAR